MTVASVPVRFAFGIPGVSLFYLLRIQCSRQNPIVRVSFSKAIALDSRMSEAFKNRGSTKYHRAFVIPGIEQAQQKELYSAIADLEEAVRINNNYAEALYGLGLAHYALNELDAARNFLIAAEKLDARYSRSTLSLALSKK